MKCKCKCVSHAWFCAIMWCMQLEFSTGISASSQRTFLKIYHFNSCSLEVITTLASKLIWWGQEKRKCDVEKSNPNLKVSKALSPWKALWYNFLKDIWEMSQILYLSWSFHLFTQTCVILRADYWIRTVKNRLGSKLSHHKHSVFKPSLFSLQSYSCHVNIQLGVNNGVNNGPWRFLHLPAALPAAGGKKNQKRKDNLKSTRQICKHKIHP